MAVIHVRYQGRNGVWFHVRSQFDSLTAARWYVYRRPRGGAIQAELLAEDRVIEQWGFTEGAAAVLPW